MAGRFLISVIAVAIAGWATSANAVSPEPNIIETRELVRNFRKGLTEPINEKEYLAKIQPLLDKHLAEIADIAANTHNLAERLRLKMNSQDTNSFIAKELKEIEELADSLQEFYRQAKSRQAHSKELPSDFYDVEFFNFIYMGKLPLKYAEELVKILDQTIQSDRDPIELYSKPEYVERISKLISDFITDYVYFVNYNKFYLNFKLDKVIESIQTKHLTGGAAEFENFFHRFRSSDKSFAFQEPIKTPAEDFVDETLDHFVAAWRNIRYTNHDFPDSALRVAFQRMKEMLEERGGKEISSNVVNRMSSTSDIRTKQCLERISSIVKPAFAVALSNGVTDKNGLREYIQLFKDEYKVGPTAYDKTLSQFDDYREYYYAHECNDVFPDPEKDAQNAVSIYKRRLKEQARSDQLN